MLYPSNIFEKLGFNQVIEYAKSQCESIIGRTHFQQIKFHVDETILNKLLTQVNELAMIIDNGELNVTLSLDFELQDKAANIDGFFYDIETLQQIVDLLQAIQKVDEFFVNNDEKYPQLASIFSSIDLDYNLIDVLNTIIGPDGEIKTNASSHLRKISAEIQKAESVIFKRSNLVFSRAKESGFLADTELGIKNGRVVLPVLSEYKRKVQGVLIDQSGTGKISYIEPLELVTLNNDLAELQIKRKQEVIRILRTVTKQVVANISEIKRARLNLGYFDFVRAKARLSLIWNAVLPQFGSDAKVFQSKHPLLMNRLAEEEKSLVPLDYILDDNHRLIVISGPNAGGKSVALKTVGLLQVMLQHGFLVPCKMESKFKIFKHIFIDIGDDQSIESDLSTYSSHLKAAKHIINYCDENTLVLMDEIGTGTDPMFGGPMAEAILERIHERRAFGIITTHFSNIKAKADQLKGVKNAAMLFDVDQLKPMYKLQIGQPGSSFSYEVASNIGLNKTLIKRARELTDMKQYDLDQLLAEVQSNQEKIKDKEQKLANKLKNAIAFEREYKDLKSSLQKQKQQIIQQANEEASHIIKAANKTIENTIRIIKESSADKQKTQKARNLLKKSVPNKSNPTLQVKKELAFKIGDYVQVINTSTSGEVVEISGKKVSVKFGNMITKTTTDKIEKVGQSSAKQVRRYISEASYLEKQHEFKSELDIRGMRVYEALAEVDRLIDSALMMGISSIRILHGKGNGILSKEIRKHLEPNTAVGSIRYEHVNTGGEGISIVELS